MAKVLLFLKYIKEITLLAIQRQVFLMNHQFPAYHTTGILQG
jgi:hypothetical protein